MRLSKTTRGWRLGMATLPKLSRVTVTPPSPGMPARTVMRVVAPCGRPETQIRSPSRVTAAPGTGGASTIQSCAMKSLRRLGGEVKARHARAGSASGSVLTLRT